MLAIPPRGSKGRISHRREVPATGGVVYLLWGNRKGVTPWLAMLVSLGLLVPLALHEGPTALLVSPALRQRLLQVELPRLEAVGLRLPCWEGPSAPDAARLWLLQPEQLVQAWRRGELADRLTRGALAHADQNVALATAGSLGDSISFTLDVEN